MSTIKSSAEHLTVTSDGTNKHTYIQDNGATKVATTTTGIDVTGDLSIGDATPQILMTDSDTSSTFKIALDGVSTNVTNSGTNGEVAFHTFNGEKLRLKTGGIDVTGTCAATAFTGDGSALTGVAQSHTSSGTAPSSPSIGDKWHDTTNEKLYMRTNDGTSNLWLQI